MELKLVPFLACLSICRAEQPQTHRCSSHMAVVPAVLLPFSLHSIIRSVRARRQHGLNKTFTSAMVRSFFLSSVGIMYKHRALLLGIALSLSDPRGRHLTLIITGEHLYSTQTELFARGVSLSSLSGRVIV